MEFHRVFFSYNANNTFLLIIEISDFIQAK